MTSKPVVEVISWFSGQGGSSYGATLAGASVIAAIDRDPWARATHSVNMPDSTVLDIDLTPLSTFSSASVSIAREIIKGCGVENPEEWEGVHLFTSPCPGFSQAGLMDVDDPRNRLVFAMLPILAATPRARLVFENVPTFLAKKYEGIQAELLSGIKELRGSVLSAQILKKYVLFAPNYGVPQKRKRLIFPIMRSGERLPEPPPRTCFKYVPIRNVIGEQFRDPDRRHLSLSPLERRLATSIQPGEDCRHGVKRDWLLARYASEHGWNGKTNLIRVCSWDDCAPTLVANLSTNISRIEALHPSRRRFTLGERLKLQCFPDGWRVLGSLEVANRQTGNAVPPPLMEAAIRQYVPELQTTSGPRLISIIAQADVA